MTKQNIDDIRGDLNTFKKLMVAVEFAVESFENHSKREQRGREMDAQLKDEQEKLNGLKDKTKKAGEELKKLADTASTIVGAANEQAAQIIAEAKAEAKKLKDSAQAEVDDLKEQAKIAASKVRELGKDIELLKEQKIAAQSNLDGITSSVESALSKLKG